jgi:cytoskeleton protein RodZ
VATEHDETTAVTPDTQSVGSILRRCREYNGIALKDAAEATRITKSYLQALEEDRPEDLPSPVYLKGFLKTYATYLGLDGEELIQLASRTTAPLLADPAPSARVFPLFYHFNWQRMLLPAVLLGALIISAFLLSPSSPERPVRPALQNVLPTTAPTVPVTALQHAVSSAQKTGAAESPLSTQPALPAETVAITPKPLDGFIIRMKVNRNSALTVTIDDAASQGYDLTSGDLIEWKASRTIALDLSDAGSVEMELNNAPLKLPPPQGKQLYIVLDANGIRR